MDIPEIDAEKVDNSDYYQEDGQGDEDLDASLPKQLGFVLFLLYQYVSLCYKFLFTYNSQPNYSSLQPEKVIYHPIGDLELTVAIS